MAAIFSSLTPCRVALTVVCALQYWQPVAVLATCATSRLRPRSTSPSGANTARFSAMTARAIAGTRCIVSRLFGTKPSVLVKWPSASARSGSVQSSTGTGSMRATRTGSGCHHAPRTNRSGARDGDRGSARRVRLERPDLDLAPARLRCLRSELEGDVQVGYVDDPEAADELLRLRVGAVG